MVLYSVNWFSLLSRKHYQFFYPVYGQGLKSLIRTQCSAEFANYQYYVNNDRSYLQNLTDPQPTNCPAQYDAYGWGMHAKDCSGYTLVDCILAALPETAKADMQAAGLVLGLMPVILTLASSTTAEAGLLILRRPFLAAILALASPAVNPISTFDYNDSLHVLKKRIGLFGPPAYIRRSSIIQNLIQYTVAAVALGNLIMVTMNLTQRAIMSNDPNRDYQVMVWALWAFAIHVFGALALMLRIRLTDLPGNSSTFPRRSYMTKVRRRIRNEFIPCSLMPKSTIVIRTGTLQVCLFMFFAWAVSMGTIVHIVYGTLIFSNLIFLSGGEALAVLLRCLASVAACRMILMYELKEMGKNVSMEEEGDPMSLRHTLTRQSSYQISLPDFSMPSLAAPDTSYTRLTS